MEPASQKSEELEPATDAPPTKPGLINRAFTAATLGVGFAIVVVMLFATLAPGPRPFLRSRVEVLGSTESTVTQPPDTIAPAEQNAARAVDLADTLPNDDWFGPLFGVQDTTFGDEPVLDALHTRCADADHVACDDLVSLTSGTRSPYELWGLTCGDRSDLVTGTCTERFGNAERDTTGDFAIGTCLTLPRSTEGTIRPIGCEEPHDAQLIANLASNAPLQALDGSFYVGPEVLASMHGVCAAAADRLMSDASWELPKGLLPAVIAPTVDSTDHSFGCFLWAPGWTLEASVIATR